MIMTMYTIRNAINAPQTESHLFVQVESCIETDDILFLCIRTGTQPPHITSEIED